MCFYRPFKRIYELDLVYVSANTLTLYKVNVNNGYYMKYLRKTNSTDNLPCFKL